MPCQTPYRGDTSQMLLYKIASCLADGGFVSGVSSFNGLTGAVTFTGADIATLLGFTPISQADGDSRYVLKAGDTMTGALAIQVTDASVTGSPIVLNLTHNLSAGVPLAGLGVSLEQSAETTTTESQRMTRWLTAWLDPVHATRTAQTTFFSVLNGVDAIQLILGNNVVQLGAAGTAAAPSLIFRNDVDTGMYFPVANSIGFSAGGSSIFTISATGVNLTDALAYQYNSVNVIRAQTALANYFFANSGNLTMTGSDNISMGSAALFSNTTGSDNTALGSAALFANTTGLSNTAIGSLSLFNNLSGGFNSAFGVRALFANTTGSSNMAVGYRALVANTTGGTNSAIGASALDSLISGSGNTAIGFGTGLGITTGSNNTILGANVAGLAAALSSNIILATGAGVIRIHVDSAGLVGIATSVQHSTLHVQGSLALAYVAKTAVYTATVSDYTIDCTSGTFDVDLPTAVGITGRIYVVKNSGAGVITIDPNGAETIDGAATQAVVAGASFTIQSTGANWIII